jgi:carboxyl-terminal processing protease
MLPERWPGVLNLKARTVLKLGLLLLLLLLPRPETARAAAAANELLEKAIYEEETKGDLKAATRLYQQIMDDSSADRSLVALAQLRLGLCQLKLGDKPQAITVLDRLTQDFPDKNKLLTIVEQHMPQLLDEMVRHIERNYIQQVDRNELMETALRAIVGKLDSRGGFLRSDDIEFLSTNELHQFNEQIQQKIAGIGTILNTNAGEVVVQSPLPGSPAFDGGLRAGDRIVTINGTALPKAKPLEAAVKLLRGPVGTPVTVGVKHADSEELHEVSLVRNTIRLPSVLGDHRKPDSTWDFMLDEPRKIGLIRLTSVGNKSVEEMRAALQDLKNRGAKTLVLDLRNNPGGMLDGAVEIADLFVENGIILTVKGRHGETVHQAKRDGTFSGFPVAVLVNRKTASAAEIVAACLQDHQRGVVVGERTFGQGIVRGMFPLESGAGALKLPVAAYYRPNGKPVNRFPDSQESDEWGVSPDPGYEVLFTEEEIKQYEKDRSARDIVGQQPPAKTDFRDRQLQKALDWLLEQSK